MATSLREVNAELRRKLLTSQQQLEQLQREKTQAQTQEPASRDTTSSVQRPQHPASKHQAQTQDPASEAESHKPQHIHNNTHTHKQHQSGSDNSVSGQQSEKNRAPGNMAVAISDSESDVNRQKDVSMEDDTPLDLQHKDDAVCHAPTRHMRNDSSAGHAHSGRRDQVQVSSYTSEQCAQDDTYIDAHVQPYVSASQRPLSAAPLSDRYVCICMYVCVCVCVCVCVGALVQAYAPVSQRQLSAAPRLD